MNSRATWIGLLVLAALGAFVWFYEIEGAAERDQTASAESRVFADLDAEDVTAFVLRTSDDVEARFESHDGRWRLVAPVDARADGPTVGAVPGALAVLESEAAYDEPEPLASYGLDVEATVRFETPGGEHALRIGDTAPVGGGTYVTDEEGARVWLVPGYQVGAFKKTLKQLREAKMLDLDTAAARRVVISSGTRQVELAREDASADWVITRPIAAPARQATVSDLLSDLAFLQADDFIDAPEEAQAASFDEPRYEVSVLLEGGGSVELAIAGDGEADRWLARGAEGAIFEIAGAAWQGLPDEVAAFRFRELARFTPSEVERFTLAFDDGAESLTVEAARTAERDWSFSGETMLGGAASRLLSELSRLEADEVLADAMGQSELAGLGLAPPRVRIRAHGAEEGEVLADVAIGAPGGDGALAAMRSDGEVVYALGADVASEIPVSLAAFREGFRAEPEPDQAQEASPVSPESGAAPLAPAPPTP